MTLVNSAEDIIKKIYAREKGGGIASVQVLTRVTARHLWRRQKRRSCQRPVQLIVMELDRTGGSCRIKTNGKRGMN